MFAVDPMAHKLEVVPLEPPPLSPLGVAPIEVKENGALVVSWDTAAQVDFLRRKVAALEARLAFIESTIDFVQRPHGQ